MSARQWIDDFTVSVRSYRNCFQRSGPSHAPYDGDDLVVGFDGFVAVAAILEFWIAELRRAVVSLDEYGLFGIPASRSSVCLSGAGGPSERTSRILFGRSVGAVVRAEI